MPGGMRAWVFSQTSPDLGQFESLRNLMKIEKSEATVVYGVCGAVAIPAQGGVELKGRSRK